MIALKKLSVVFLYVLILEALGGSLAGVLLFAEPHHLWAMLSSKPLRFCRLQGNASNTMDIRKQCLIITP